MKRILLLIISIVLIVSLFQVISKPYIVVKTENNSELFRFSIEEHNKLIIKYTHSVTGGDVKSFLTTENNKINIYKEEFEEFGAGLADPGSSSVKRNQEDNIVVTVDNRKKDSISLRVGEIANQKLLFNNKEINLLDYVQPGEAIILTVEKKFPK